MTTAGNIDPKFSALQSSRNAKLALPKGFEKFISIHTGETVAVTVTVTGSHDQALSLSNSFRAPGSTGFRVVREFSVENRYVLN